MTTRTRERITPVEPYAAMIQKALLRLRRVWSMTTAHLMVTMGVVYGSACFLCWYDMMTVQS